MNEQQHNILQNFLDTNYEDIIVLATVGEYNQLSYIHSSLCTVLQKAASTIIMLLKMTLHMVA